MPAGRSDTSFIELNTVETKQEAALVVLSALGEKKAVDAYDEAFLPTHQRLHHDSSLWCPCLYKYYQQARGRLTLL